MTALAEAGGHRPVMLAEVMHALGPRDEGVYVDGTFGGGGCSRALLEAAHCTVWGIDRDPEAIERGAGLARQYPGRLTLIKGRFGDMVGLLRSHQVATVDGVALDLGLSSLQLDDPERGFSFRLDGPLDMRMEKLGPSAADIVNGATEDELADIIHRYGEEPNARRIARAIVKARASAPISRTGELADLVRSAVRRGPRGKKGRDGIDPATRTFQALRIYLNDELGELDRGLSAAEVLLSPGGTLVVVSFHSLEDRKVKSFLRARSGGAPHVSRFLPADDRRAASFSFELLTRRAIRPSTVEVARNPRARSARLRAAERTAAPAWPMEHAA